MTVTPDLADFQKAKAAAEREDAFWKTRYDEYLQQYPDQFVAVSRSDGAFVAASADLDTLLQAVAGRGLRVGQVWTRFMAATPIYFVR